MNTKEKLINLFEHNRGIYFSGEEIAKKFSISRSAVWKAVKTLQNEGYSVNAVTNKGYCLLEENDIISVQGIQKYLDNTINKLDITISNSISSTNSFMKEQANNGSLEGCIIISNEQKSGRGRKGRTFFSPKDTGIYMSILLRPTSFQAKKAVSITTMAAVAMCEAIEEVSKKNAYIKWVNDIFVDNKKVCGILTEGSFDIENDSLEYAVLGLGINVYKPTNGFPDEIANTAGSIFETNENDVKNSIIAKFLNHFFYYYNNSLNKEYIEKYRNKSFILGKEINVLSGNSLRKATALEIDDNCHLKVKYFNGEIETLSSGEISISHR